jgi:hypothetical protein
VAAILLASANSCQSLSITRPCAHSSRSATACRYANDDYNDGFQDVIKRRPRRAMPHITASRAEEATRAGYIIRQNHVFSDTSAREQTDGNGRRIRPLRVIRRIVLRGGGRRDELNSSNVSANTEASLHEHGFDCDELTEEVTVNVRYGSPNKTPPSSFSSEKTVPNRVTFKSTRQASHSLQSLGLSSKASLTEYMTQPVEQYSLLSFHDEESDANVNSAKARRWLVRRLTAIEAQRYMNKSEHASPANADNLFRLAVPLLPLIGWDLTPVIDLEVIPPNSTYDSAEAYDHEIQESKWAPLKGIRGRVNRNQGNDATVKIRSLRVSLLSTQEVHAAMNCKQSNTDKSARRQNSSLKMQEEALGMVGKVEEWLRPHISFEAELSWNDAFAEMSTVTAKATAITSLIIPKIPSGILRASVPSAFLVKRLGTTLTSKALEICLPRFLRQLDRDYKRWSGVDEASSTKSRQKSHI